MKIAPHQLAPQVPKIERFTKRCIYILCRIRSSRIVQCSALVWPCSRSRRKKFAVRAEAHGQVSGKTCPIIPVTRPGSGKFPEKDCTPHSLLCRRTSHAHPARRLLHVRRCLGRRYPRGRPSRRCEGQVSGDVNLALLHRCALSLLDGHRVVLLPRTRSARHTSPGHRASRTPCRCLLVSLVHVEADAFCHSSASLCAERNM